MLHEQPPPAADQRSPAGWYADPLVSGNDRYWDGAQWTGQIQTAQGPLETPTEQLGNEPLSETPGGAGTPTYNRSFGGWLSEHWRGPVIGVVAFVVGAGMGALGAANDDEVANLKDKISTLRNQASTLQGDVTDARDLASAAKQRLADQQGAIKQRQQNLKDQARQQQAAYAAKQQGLQTREQKVAGAEQQLKANTIPNGTWQSGRDFQPGLYRAPGGSNCYWAKLGSADTNDIIDNGLGAHPTVQIDSPFFETDGCGDWTKIG